MTPGTLNVSGVPCGGRNAARSVLAAIRGTEVPSAAVIGVVSVAVQAAGTEISMVPVSSVRATSVGSSWPIGRVASVSATLLVGPATVVGVTGATVLATAWVTAVVVCTGGVMTGVVTAVVATPPATVVATPPATVVAAPGVVVTTGPAPATTLNELSTVCSATGSLVCTCRTAVND